MKKIITITIMSFLGVIFLAGCGSQKILDDNMVKEMNKNQGNNQEQNQIQQQIAPEELIDFEHPGNDEAGKKIQEMDEIINSTSSSGYTEDLSGEILSEQE